jgi:hypothetical protein
MNYLAPVCSSFSGVNQLPYNNIKIILKVNKKIIMRIASVHPTACDRGSLYLTGQPGHPNGILAYIQKRISSKEPAGW